MKNLLLLLLSLLLKESISQNIWKPTNGPTGLQLIDFVVTSDNKLIISEESSGIYRSSDAGLSWQKINNGLYNSEGYASSFVAGNNGVVYAIIGTNLFRLNANSDQWVLLRDSLKSNLNMFCNPLGNLYIIDRVSSIMEFSIDQGMSFQKILINQPFTDINLYKFEGNGNNLISLHENQSYNLYRMSDDGAVLTKLLGSTKQLRDFFWHPSGHVFIYTNDYNLLRMDGNGMNLDTIPAIGFIPNRFFVRSNGNILAFDNATDYESVNLGESWTQRSSELFRKIDKTTKFTFQGNIWYVFNEYKYCSANTLELTKDEGLNWSNFENSFTGSKVNDLFFDSKGRLFARRCDFGLYSYSTDKGNTWEELNLPVEPSLISQLVSTRLGDLFMVLGYRLYKSTDLGKTWVEKPIPGVPLNNRFFALTGDQKNIMYAFGDSANVVSQDGGDNWNKIVAPTKSFINKLFFNPDGSVIGLRQLTGTTTFFNDVYFSDDSGMHWKNVTLDTFTFIDAFAISGKGTIYLSGFKSKSHSRKVYASNDKLNTLSIIKPDGDYDALIVGKDETIYAALGSICERSTDLGKTWESFDLGIPADRNATSIIIDKDDYLYLGFDDDVVYKTENTITSTFELNKNKFDGKVIVQPNPVSNDLRVIIQSNQIQFPINWQIYNIVGKIVLTGKLNATVNSISIESIPNGVYLIKFGDLSLSGDKIVIQH